MPSSEKVISPGVFTNEIDQSFLPAAIADIGAAIIGPTVKGPAGVPTVVNSYSEFQAKFGDTFLSGSDYYTYLTSLSAKNYLKHGSSLLVTRVLPSGYGGANSIVSSSATTTAANLASGSLVLKGGSPTTNMKVTIGSVNFTVVDNTVNSMSLYPNTSTQFWIASGSIMGAGTSVMALPPFLQPATKKGEDGGTVQDVVKEMANIIHRSFKATMFTGTVIAGTAVIPAPLVGTLQ